jgi:hypothetical protein
MQLKNLYYFFSSIISKQKCEEIIEYGNSVIKKNKQLGISTTAVTFGDKHKQENKNSIPQLEKSFQQLKKEGISKEDVYVRDSEIAFLNDKWIYDLILPIIDRANSEAKWNFEIDTQEQIQFTTYNPGGFYSWHSDGGSDYYSRYKRYMFGISKDTLKEDGSIPMGYTTSHNMVGKIRKLSLTLNLSDPKTYKGGNLLFDFGDKIKLLNSANLFTKFQIFLLASDANSISLKYNQPKPSCFGIHLTLDDLISLLDLPSPATRASLYGNFSTELKTLSISS